MMSITGEAGGDPVRVGVAITDLTTGLYATSAILAALFERERKGHGQKIDVSLLDAATALNSYMAMFYFATGTPPGRLGSRIPTIVPYQAFSTADGYVVIAVGSEHLWPRFCAAIEHEELVNDERFATNERRVENREVLEPLLEEVIATYETETIVDRLEEHGVPVTPINAMDAVYDDPQVRARGMRRAVDHPTVDDLEMPGVPMHFSRTPGTIREHPPLLGEHTDEILAEFGYDEREIERFHADGVV